MKNNVKLQEQKPKYAVIKLFIQFAINQSSTPRGTVNKDDNKINVGWVENKFHYFGQILAIRISQQG